MSTHDNGGPAFPVPGLQHDESFNGMTLRDYFAAMAMQGILASGARHLTAADPAKVLLSSAYRAADPMLQERAK